MDIGFTSVVYILPIESHVGHKKWQILTIYHLGTHKCELKPNTKIYTIQVREAVLRNSGLSVCSIHQLEVDEAVAASDIQEVWRRAMQLSYTNSRYEKAKPGCERNSGKHSLEAVGILNKAKDMEDK